MSKHVWLVAPSKKKADRLNEGYSYAMKMGATGDQARVFAGYWCECNVQGGLSGTKITEYEGVRFRSWYLKGVEEIYTGCVNNEWKILKGKNADNYRRVFFRHNIYWCGGVDASLNCRSLDFQNLVSALYDGDFTACGPLQDWLLENGYEAAAYYYRT